MIINCPCCKKKFEVDSNLIPDQGKLLKCGSCDQTWFYTPNKNIPTEVQTEKEQGQQIAVAAAFGAFLVAAAAAGFALNPPMDY